MPKYLVMAEMTISVHTEVEADTLEEAIEIAQGRPVMGLCHQCAASAGSSHADLEEWRTNGELDGEPARIQAEPLDD